MRFATASRSMTRCVCISKELLRANIVDSLKIDLLVASAMQRTIQTCLVAFSPCVDRGLDVVAMPMAQEGTDELSDVGSDPEKLKSLFEAHVDYSHVKPGWNEKRGENGVDAPVVMARAIKLRRWLKARKESNVVLVTHGRFAHFLTGDVDENGEQTTGWWEDAELRSFDFVSSSSDEEDEAAIRETDESLSNRKEQ